MNGPVVDIASAQKRGHDVPAFSVNLSVPLCTFHMMRMRFMSVTVNTKVRGAA